MTMQNEVTEPVEEVKVEPQAEVKTEEPKKEDKPNRLQQRIDEMARARHEAEREAAFWREAATKKDEKPADKPNKAEFADDESYIEALTDWKASQAASKAIEKLQQEREQQSQRQAEQAKAQTYESRLEAVRTEIEDFDEVVTSADVRVSGAVRDAILDSELGPQLTYHLAKNPDVVKKLAGLSPVAQIREIGRLEAEVQKAPTKPVTKAPTPITPTRGSGGQFTKDESTMGAAEWAEFYRSKYRK